jgi:hypothetical protein
MKIKEQANQILAEKKTKIQFQRNINSTDKNPNEPCPECGTILMNFINVKIGDVPKHLKQNLFICSHCCQYLAGPPIGIKIQPMAGRKVEIKKPRGWHFLKKFVDSEGNYFEFGEEKPELKGTADPTFSIKPKEAKVTSQKITKKKKLKMKNTAAAILFELKRKHPENLNKNDKKTFDSYLTLITQIASGLKFPKNYEEIFTQYEKDIKKL